MKDTLILLRGINVSGKNPIRMAELKKVLENAGYLSVRTYIQSGNVLIKSDTSSASYIAGFVKSLIKTEFGFDIPVIAFSRADLEKIIESNPYRNNGYDMGKIHVSFLWTEPDKENKKQLEELSFEPDEIKVKGGIVYLHAPEGYGSTKYTNTFIEKKLDLIATTRNWKTCNALLDMMEES